MITIRLHDGSEQRFYLLGDKPHELRLRGGGIECNLLEMMHQAGWCIISAVFPVALFLCVPWGLWWVVRGFRSDRERQGRR